MFKVGDKVIVTYAKTRSSPPVGYVTKILSITNFYSVLIEYHNGWLYHNHGEPTCAWDVDLANIRLYKDRIMPSNAFEEIEWLGGDRDT